MGALKQQQQKVALPQLVPVPEAFPLGALCLFMQVHFGRDLKSALA